MMPVTLDKRYSAIAAAGLLIVAAALLLAPLWPILHSQWTGVSTYRHGYLVGAMAVWLAWHRWRQNPPPQVGPDWRFLVPLVGSLAALAVFELLFLNVPRLFLLPPLIVVVVGLVFGRPAASHVLWPAVLLYGALPIWPEVSDMLQSLTTAVVSTLLAWIRVPAFIEGNFVQIPSGVFEIAQGCSGIGYLIVGLTLTLFYGVAYLPTWKQRGVLMAAAVLFTILCNWVRVLVIIVAGYLTQMQHYLVSVEHDTFGWVLLMVFMLPVLWVRNLVDTAGPPEKDKELPLSVYAKPHKLFAAAGLACLLLGLPRAATIAVAGMDASAAELVPLESAGTGTPRAASLWQPVFANALEERATFDAGGEVVEFYRALYVQQDAGHRLITYANSFVPPSWQPVSRKDMTVPISGESALSVIELEGYLGEQRRLVWGWYMVAGRPAASSLQAKLLELMGLVSGRRDAVAVALSGECLTDCGSVRGQLTAFAPKAKSLGTLERTE